MKDMGEQKTKGHKIIVFTHTNAFLLTSVQEVFSISFNIREKSLENYECVK